MWQFEHTVETDASPGAVWRLYEDAGGWPSWDAGLSHVDLHGPFQPGTEGTLTPAGQEPVAFTITDVRPGEGFADETRVAGVTLRFSHALRALDGGGTAITHRAEVDGPAAEAIGPQVTAGMPEAMESLARAAQR